MILIELQSCTIIDVDEHIFFKAKERKLVIIPIHNHDERCHVLTTDIFANRFFTTLLEFETIRKKHCYGMKTIKGRN